MSDPEDLQSDTKSGLGDWIYQLKRIGPPATCPKVPDVMKLSLGLTKIGRGQQNDFYLDSAVLKNFISRSHVEIFGKKNENGEVEYLLTDKGLNGTFINDIRTHKTCVMEVGDKVTFGHTNGYKIQPGSYAEQPLSEFQFMFERVPRLRKVQEILSEGPIATDTPDDDSSSRVDTPDLKTESTISDRLFLSDIQSNVQQSQKSEKSATSKSWTSLKGRNRKDSSENSDMELPLPSSKNSSHSKTKSKQVTKKRNSDSSNKSLSLETSQTSSRSRASTGSARDRFSETIAAQNDDDDDDDDDDDNDDVDENNDNNNEEESNDSSMSEEEEIVKPKSQVRRKRTQRKVSVQKKAPAKRKITAPSDSDESSEEDEASKPEADQKPKAPSMKQKQLKKKKTGNDAPAIGSRKRRRKTGASGQSTSTTSAQDDLEPGVEWYEDDRCEAPDCKRPKKKRTPWVQCDDCDSWYHTVCVGANYNRLKDSDEHFNCGCE